MTWSEMVAFLFTPITVIVSGVLFSMAGAFANVVKKWRDPSDDTLVGAFWLAFWTHSLSFFYAVATCLLPILLGAITLAAVKGTDAEMSVAFAAYAQGIFTAGFTFNSYAIGMGKNGNGQQPPKP